MAILDVAEIGPYEQRGGGCPFDCNGCEHLIGVYMDSGHKLEIECDAPPFEEEEI